MTEKKPTIPSLKPKKCKVCKAGFAPTKPMQSVCSPACALSLASSKRARAEKIEQIKGKRETRAKLASLKTMGKLIAEAQTAFNAYIRVRDQLAGHACISSGRPLDWSGNGVDAGHYRSRGSAPHLRFDERNCHAQSKQENRYASGNATGYRVGLIARIGMEALEALECDQTPRKYGRDDLKAIKAQYAAKTKQLKESRE